MSIVVAYFEVRPVVRVEGASAGVGELDPGLIVPVPAPALTNAAVETGLEWTLVE